MHGLEPLNVAVKHYTTENLHAATPISMGQPAPPNIVFIMANNMGYGDPACYNPESKIPTPDMDKLATEGMRFTDVHSPAAVHTPTRYGVIIGRYGG